MNTVVNDFGKRLISAREAKKLSVQEAARATRMRAAYIEALESGNYSRFPNAAYAKSFLLMYGKFLKVDVSEMASTIDTTTQMGVSDFQYLSARADDEKEKRKAATVDSRYDFVVAKRESRSWLPLIIGGGIAALAAVVSMVWMNLSRIADQNPEDATAKAAPPPAAAVQPVEPPPIAKTPPNPAPAPAAVEETPAPRPAVVSLPPGTAPVAVPVEPEIPRARPISPIASIAASDTDLLAEIPTPAPAVVTPPPAAPTAVQPPKPAADPNGVHLEALRTTWVVIRTGPGGQPLFEDYLYQSGPPMKLRPGKYYIELKDADAVRIVRNGRPISYIAPGVLVQ